MLYRDFRLPSFGHTQTVATQPANLRFGRGAQLQWPVHIDAQGLNASIYDTFSSRLDDEAGKCYSKKTIELSRKSGICPNDIEALNAFSQDENLLIVIRNPVPSSRIWRGLFKPKAIATKAKSNECGVVETRDGRVLVSDYDLMSVWCREKDGDDLHKVFMSAEMGQDRGGWSHQATRLLRRLNHRLVSRIQHGCQDDFLSSKNPGLILSSDHFTVFDRGRPLYLESVKDMAKYYREQGITWLYDDEGRYRGPELNKLKRLNDKHGNDKPWDDMHGQRHAQKPAAIETPGYYRHQLEYALAANV